MSRNSATTSNSSNLKAKVWGVNMMATALNLFACLIMIAGKCANQLNVASASRD
jgi:hypothetical protein